MPVPSELDASDRSVNLAWLRTRMAMERTLMAWIRTATALIGFGFTIFQFFDRLSQMKGIAAARDPWMPSVIALALVGSGTVGIVVGLFEYRQVLRYLWSEPFSGVAGIGRRPQMVPSVVVAVFLAIVGLITFLALANRMRG